MESKQDNASFDKSMKLQFLSSAISDVSTYIQFADTKVPIIMGATVALLAGVMACAESIAAALSSVSPCSWKGISLIILVFVAFASMSSLFVNGIRTLRMRTSHVCLNKR